MAQFLLQLGDEYKGSFDLMTLAEDK